VSQSLARAFPVRLATVTAAVTASIPEPDLPPSHPVTTTSSRTWPGLVVDHEPVIIPHRIYNAEPPHPPAGLSRTGELVMAAWYSRHHDGRVRHRQLGTLLAADEPWAAPFVIALLGEYVIEICRDIEQFIRTEPAAPGPAMLGHLAGFLDGNPSFAELTRQRALSYWSLHYR
jgi:hypothetical protein